MNTLAEIKDSEADLAAAVELHGIELNAALAASKSLNREDTEAHDQRDPRAELDGFLFVFKDALVDARSAQLPKCK
jgi:hypothetical protein